mmetsp:Transcript_44303/g.39544  ORF Transcript_44303/g.39544 Transcript_44303/m.39544 type:complete len:104 (+) Transcript_44303:2-313(+)
MVRFSFLIPSITRDTLFIQTQISMEFTEDNSGRRLLGSGGATQMIYESGAIQIMDKPAATEIINEQRSTEENKEEEEEEESDRGCIHMFVIAISIVLTMVLIM